MTGQWDHLAPNAEAQRRVESVAGRFWTPLGLLL